MSVGAALTYNVGIKIPLYYQESNDSTPKQLSVAQVNEIIELIPKNLNGNTLLIKFITARSENAGQNITVTTNNGINNQFVCNAKSININNFINGTLLITSDLDDIIILSKTDLDNMNSLTALEMSEHELNKEIKALINLVNSNNNIPTQTKVEPSAYCTFNGTGINKNYSVFSIRDCNVDCYIYNLNIYNNLPAFTDTAINVAKEGEAKDHLPTDETVNFVFLCNNVQNEKFYSKEKYLNRNIFSDNNIVLNIDSKEPSLANLVSDISGISFCRLNTTIADEIAKGTLSLTQPTYFTFSSDGDVLNNTAFRSNIYNWNNKTNISKNVSMCFYGTYTGINENIPLFCDYDINNPTSAGLLVYANKISRIEHTKNITNQAEYYSDITDYHLRDLSGLYVIDFITTSGEQDIDDINRYPYNTLNEGETVYPFAPSTLSEGKMRVNVSFYHTDNNNNINCIKCIPNQTTVNKAKCVTSPDNILSTFTNELYEFNSLPDTIYNQDNYAVRFFGQRIKNASEEGDSVGNWQYFTGNVRNLMCFNRLLTGKEISALILTGIEISYEWTDPFEKEIVKNIDTNSYIGALGISNSNKINLVNIGVSSYIATK